MLLTSKTNSHDICKPYLSHHSSDESQISQNRSLKVNFL